VKALIRKNGENGQMMVQAVWKMIRLRVNGGMSRLGNCAR